MSDDPKPPSTAAAAAMSTTTTTTTTTTIKKEATKTKPKPRVRISFQEEIVQTNIPPNMNIPQGILSYPSHDADDDEDDDDDDDDDDDEDDDDDDEEMVDDDHHSSALVKSALSSTSRLSRKKRGKKKKALTWDEDAIEEHDLLRGTRMKIDEPDTPFNYCDHHPSDDDTSVARSVSSATNDNNSNNNNNNLADNWNRLERSIAAVAAIRGRSHSPSGSMSSSHNYTSDSSHDGKSLSSAGSGGPRLAKERIKMKEVEFKMNRKAHYNEMDELRRWKMEHGDDDDDDDEEEDMNMEA